MSLREPLRFRRHPLVKVWGGRALERRPGIELPPGEPIGETWEIVDREGESSVVAEGPYEGRTLRELMQAHSDDVLGRVPPARDGRFPLLVKYIDAAQNLSVQVHPDDDTAARLGGEAEGKTEAWYVLDVAPQGTLWAGLRSGVTRDAFEPVAARRGVVDTLMRWDVRPGDCVLVPGGTVHAIGAGVTILEVQQNSDTTYRLYDWGRKGLDGRPRETHVPQALECVRFGQPARPPIKPLWMAEGDGVQRSMLARSHYFAMNAFSIEQAAPFETDGQFHAWAVVGGEGVLVAGDVPWHLGPGDVWLVPAACGEYRVEPRGVLELVQLLHRS